MRRRGLGSAKLQITNHKLQIPQRGYMLITLVLALALITIALLTVLPEIGQQIRRDREDEMRHRGTAYMRAIQHFYRKFNRYPARVEDLENTNNLRFLRKRYKDPINRDPVTGKERDFKFLRQTDINLNNGPVLGLTPSGPPGGAKPGGDQPTEGSDTQTNESGDSGNRNPNAPKSSPSSSGFSGPTFGGGPILGVASTSKAKTIHVFYEKSHYNDWFFIYLPQADRGGLLTGPVNPGMPAGNLGGVTPGQTLSGQGQGPMPTSPQTQVQPTQPAQNPGQTPPEE
jgi:type II secretory pathway pseudopilin PulG